jgi:formylglycine-generating enzyme required for sulfatase activity
MAGNVWEWVEDCQHESYSGAPSDGSAWTAGCSKRSDGKVPRVLRGGSWYDTPYGCRAAYRNYNPDVRDLTYGIRVVRVVSARTP